MLGFSGWSLLGNTANIGSQHGINILLNIFFGVTINTAMGIANQVSHAVYNFISNFQIAFNPQIVKSYASNNRDYFENLIFQSSKISYYLLFIIVLPILFSCEFIFELWLDAVPEYAVTFAYFIFLSLLVDAVSAPLWISIQATGKIRNYQIIISCILLLNIPLSYIVLKIEQLPCLVLAVRLIINIIAFVFRTWYSSYIVEFSCKKYLKNVILKVLLVSLIAIPVPLFAFHVLNDNVETQIAIIIIAFLSSVFTIFFFGLNKKERDSLKRFIMIKCRKILIYIIVFSLKIYFFFVELFSKDYILVTSSINPIVHNWGDDVSIRLVKLINTHIKIIPVVYSWNIKGKIDYLCIGSIIPRMISSSSIIWGSGVVYPEQCLKNKPITVLAVRGPLTRKYLLDNGINCPEIYGDPALLFPRYYMPLKIKKYKLGVVPHFRDKNNPIVDKICEENDVHFIDVQKIKSWTIFIDEINQCDFIISSSLHGIIIADAYMVPNLWVEFKGGEKKRFAFRDYMLSVSRNIEIPVQIDENYVINDLLAFKNDWHKPEINLDRLFSVCPFNKNLKTE
jgi:hypothetical protein